MLGHSCGVKYVFTGEFIPEIMLISICFIAKILGVIDVILVLESLFSND